jgi:hypothetical protein
MFRGNLTAQSIAHVRDGMVDVHRRCLWGAARAARGRSPRSLVRGTVSLGAAQKRAPCSSASRTNRRLPDLRCGRIREHDHTGAPANCAFIVVRTLLRLFGVHGANVGVGGRQRIDQHCVPGPLAQRSAANCGLLTAAARTGLRPAPESRSRGARPHLSRSFTNGFSSC